MKKLVCDVNSLPDSCYLQIPHGKELADISTVASETFEAMAEIAIQKYLKQNFPEICAMADRYKTIEHSPEGHKYWEKNGLDIIRLGNERSKFKATLDKQKFHDNFILNRSFSVNELPKIGETWTPTGADVENAIFKLFSFIPDVPRRGSMLVIPAVNATLFLLPTNCLELEYDPDPPISPAAIHHFESFDFYCREGHSNAAYKRAIMLSVMIFALSLLSLQKNSTSECIRAIRWVLNKNPNDLKTDSLYWRAINHKIRKLIET